MALKKTIVNDTNGLSTNYHRIIEISRDGKDINLGIRSYISKENRDNEKENESLKVYWEDRRNEIEAIRSKPAEERTDEENILLENALNAYVTLNSVGQFYIDTVYISIQQDCLKNDFSFSKIYNILKTTEPYNGAEDI